MKILRVTNQSMMDETYKVRFDVFVHEQHVPKELELDEYDDQAIHVIALNEQDEVVGCGRLILNASSAKIGRVAVRKEYRKLHFGKAICEELIRIAQSENIQKITLGAQLSAVEFYKKLGFTEYGTVYMDANIKHIHMVYSGV